MFKSAATKLAHNTTVPGLGGNKDLRPLQDLITAEKQVLISLQKLSVDFAKAADALRIWGSGEGEDLGDILTASTTLLSLYSSSLSHFSSLSTTQRDMLKSLRTREESLDSLRRRRRSLLSKADSADRKLAKTASEHKSYQAQVEGLNQLREEIRGLDGEIMSEEAHLGDLKRSVTRQWVGLKFSGLVEVGEKGTIIGEYGKLITSSIPEETTQPGMARSLYYGRPKVESLLNEAVRCLNEVKVASIPESTYNPNDKEGLGGMGVGSGMGGMGGHVSSTNATEWSSSPDGQIHLHPPSNSGIPSGERGEFLPPTWTPSNGNFMSTSGSGSQPSSPLGSHFTGTSGGQGYEQYNTMPNLGQGGRFMTAGTNQVDDFGAPLPLGQQNTGGVGGGERGGISSPMDAPPAGSGGRFATFPVKGRPMGVIGPSSSASPLSQDNTGGSALSYGYSNTNLPSGAGGVGGERGQGDRPPPIRAHSQDDSFSSSVMEALRSSQSPPGSEPPTGAVFDGRPGFGLGNHTPTTTQSFAALGTGGIGGERGLGAGHGPHTPGEATTPRYTPPEGPPPGFNPPYSAVPLSATPTSSSFTSNLPPGAAQPRPLGQGGERNSYHSGLSTGGRSGLEEDVTLAYAHDPEEELGERRELRAEEGLGQGGEKNHVRFGGESTIGDRQGGYGEGRGGHRVEESFDPYTEHARGGEGVGEKEKGREGGRGRERERDESVDLSRYPSGPPEYSAIEHREMGGEGAAPPLNEKDKERESPIEKRSIPDVPSRSLSPSPPAPSTEPAYANQRRVPVPAVGGSPPPSTSPQQHLDYGHGHDQHQHQQEHRGGAGDREGRGDGEGEEEEEGPLAPPSAPFQTRRGVSPRPDFEKLARQSGYENFASTSPSSYAPPGPGGERGGGAGGEPLVPGVPRIATAFSREGREGRGGGIDSPVGGGERGGERGGQGGSVYGTPMEYPARDRGLGMGLPSTPAGEVREGRLGGGAVVTGGEGKEGRLGGGTGGTPSPGGARTISAAAFRRPQRMASGNELNAPGKELPLADTSPLAFNKKRLPASPYPGGRGPERGGDGGVGREGGGGREGREGSPRPTARSGYPGFQPGTIAVGGGAGRDQSPKPGSLRRAASREGRGMGSREGSPRPSLLERKRSGSIPRAPDGPPPVGALPPLPSSGSYGQGERRGYAPGPGLPPGPGVGAHGGGGLGVPGPQGQGQGQQGGEDEEYDYLGAYVHTGATPQPGEYVPAGYGRQGYPSQQRQEGGRYQGGGYGDGRYATNLEDSGLT